MKIIKPNPIFANMIISLLRPHRFDLLARYAKQTLTMLGATVRHKVVPKTTVVMCDQQLVDSCHPEFLFALVQGFQVVSYDWLYASLYHKQRERVHEYAIETDFIRDKLNDHDDLWRQMKHDALADLGTDGFRLLRDVKDLFQCDVELVRLNRKLLRAEKVELRIWESFAPHRGGPAREYRVVCKHRAGPGVVVDDSITTVYGHSSDALVHFKHHFAKYTGYAWDERHSVEHDSDDEDDSQEDNGRFKYIDEEHLP